MPIDLRCFEQRPELKDDYIRGHSDGGNCVVDVRELLTMVLEQRATMIRLRNDRDRYLAAHRRQGKDKANSKHPSRDEAQSSVAAADSHTVILKKMEEQLAEAASVLNETMWQLPNWIDVDLAQTLDVPDATDSIPSSHTAAPVMNSTGDTLLEMTIPSDPLFASRCYEGMDNATVFVGSGHLLATALQEYFVKALSSLTAKNSDKNDVARTLQVTATGALSISTTATVHSTTHWTLPATFTSSPPVHTLDCFMAHCARTGKSQTQPLTTPSIVGKKGPVGDDNMPSWISLLRNQAGTYWDRQLPRMHILSTTATAADTPSSKSTDSIPEMNRKQSWRTNSGDHKAKRKSPAAWYERLAIPQQIQVVVLTGPSLEADSRPWQRRFMEHVLQCYQALIVYNADGAQEGTTARTENFHASSRFLRIQAVPASELSLMESSRLQLWGYWPNQVSRPPVCLAYLSNLQDYCTTNAPTCELRHGTTKEGLHVLHGVVCSVGETMEWMSQHGARRHVMLVPQCIVSSSRSDLPERIVYTRRVVVNANGKRHVQEIVVPPAAVADPKETTSTGHDLTKSETTQPPRRPEQQALQDPNKLPPVNTAMPQTPERIRAEALSSPFFLPFYYR